MKSRKVRLEDAYLGGVQGFCTYIKNYNKASQERFYKVILLEFDKIDVAGVTMEEKIFYLLGFFDKYEIEKKKHSGKDTNWMDISEEKWLQDIMKKLDVEDISTLQLEMIRVLMSKLEEIYVDSKSMEFYLIGRMKESNSRLAKRYLDSLI